ncbi:MAG: Ppx/GppA phosphatase family protein [Wenzhouxiangellaceae bacterium]|nr:Ppx/GppA phosphatase family protein [Wenzhouxiangellaceae bacterium]
MSNRDLFAAVDLGSNSFHMLVARREHGELRFIDRIREPVRIGGGLDDAGRLDSDTEERALDCLARFGQRLAEIPSRQVRAVGTQTLRRMRRAERFLARAEAALGGPIDVVPGREEARLVWVGVTQGTGFRDTPRVVIDIGGGSTEIAAGNRLEPALAESTQFGCVATTRQAFPDGRITAKRWKRAREEISGELQAIVEALRATGWQQAIGASGTVRAVQGILAARADNLPAPIARDALDALCRDIVAAGHVGDVDLPGLSGTRQPVISGGALILQACMRTLEIDRLEVSPFALREGVLYDLVGRLAHRDPREKAVLAMAARHEVDMAQADRVRDFALAAFEQVAEAFRLEEIHRDILGWACRLHETGLAIAHSHYQVHSGYIVEQSDMAGFSQQERRFLAVLVRLQRRKLPPDPLEDLPERLRRSARPLLALLRLAVALCRARNDADLPDFALETDGDTGLLLRLSGGWADAHPLSARELALQKRQLRRLGFQLKLDTLAEPPVTGS